MHCGTISNCATLLLQLLAIGLSNGAVIALNAIGVTLVYGAVRMINFAHGDLFALTTVLVTFAIEQLGLQAGFQAGPLLGGLLLTLGAAMLFGAVLNVGVERLAFRPFRGGSALPPLIATVGLSFILFQLAVIWRRTQPDWNPAEHRSTPRVNEVPLRRIPDVLGDRNLVQLLGIDSKLIYTLKDLIVLVLAIVLTALVGAWLGHTRAGRAVRACAQDPELAEMSGVNRSRIITLVFAVGGALAGAAGFVFALYYDRPFAQHGIESGLVALTAAVLGGIGRPRGAFWGGLLLGVITALSDYFLAAQWTPVLVLVVLIGLLFLRPTGLFGEDQSADVVTAPTITVVADRAVRRPSARSRALTLALGSLALAYPLLDRGLQLYQQVAVIGIVIYAVLALGLNLLLGFTGLLDLGYAACFAVGGYAAAWLMTAGVQLISPALGDFLVVLLLSGAITGLVGVVLGGLARRLRGEYLALVTLAFGQLVLRVLINLSRWTGGDGGLGALPPPRIVGFVVRAPWAWYYLALAVLALIALASRRLAASRLGRAWAAVSADEAAATSCGVNPERTKTSAFVLGAAIAGVAGALYATMFSYVAPGQSEFALSAMILAMVIIGGAGSVRGVLIATVLVASYDRYGIRLLGAGLERLGHALGTSLFTVLDPRGLSIGSFGLALYLTMLIRARQRPPQPAASPPARRTWLPRRADRPR